jgi:hypothetical protein
MAVSGNASLAEGKRCYKARLPTCVFPSALLYGRNFDNPPDTYVNPDATWIRQPRQQSPAGDACAIRQLPNDLQVEIEEGC